MATYLEIESLFSNGNLLKKVRSATIIYAQSIAVGTPDTKQNAWIAQVFNFPDAEARAMLMGVLAANKDFTKEQIESASDANIQTEVDLIGPILINALAGV